MNLEDLGYSEELENYRKDQGLISLGVARVISEHRERYVVKTAEDEYEAEVIGNLRFSAQKRSDFPAVGDWVAISEYDEKKVLIHAVFPRRGSIERRSAGKQDEIQIIATNIDFALIVQAVDRDFNINRLQRYLTICNTAGVEPIVLLNKIDLVNDEDISDLISRVQERVKHVPVIAFSNETGKGYDALISQIAKSKTYCLLGSSGVGKSTLINNLSGKSRMKTGTISSSTSKGRHITSHRELIVLENGGILIDNPGMREVGMTDSESGIGITFDDISALAENCKFTDCTHTGELGCAVLEALENGKIDENSYENYLKIEREKEHFESKVAERRKKEKAFGKIIKNYKKYRNKNNL